jgi:tyrosyl-tRNA synthetase
LLTKPDGGKFGKTESGAVWLSAERTSVYRFYQFLIQTDDAQVIQLLRWFTFLSLDEISVLEAEHLAAPEKREAHRRLARELTRLVHGEKAAEDAVRASAILFGGSLEGITEAQFGEVAAEVPNVTLPRAILGQPAAALPEILVAAKLSPSKSQARRDVEAGGVYINNAQSADPKLVLVAEHLLFGKFVLLRKGKRNYALAQFE